MKMSERGSDFRERHRPRPLLQSCIDDQSICKHAQKSSDPAGCSIANHRRSVKVCQRFRVQSPDARVLTVTHVLTLGTSCAQDHHVAWAITLSRARFWLVLGIHQAAWCRIATLCSATILAPTTDCGHGRLCSQLGVMLNEALREGGKAPCAQLAASGRRFAIVHHIDHLPLTCKALIRAARAD